MANYEKEWCSIKLLGFKVCLQVDFELRSWDTFMCGIKLREGIAFTIFGPTLGIMWSYQPNKPRDYGRQIADL